MDKLKFAIEYEHLKDEYDSKWHFKRIVELANKYELELSDEDFERFYKLERNGKDVSWLMHCMTISETGTLIDALVSMITW